MSLPETNSLLTELDDKSGLNLEYDSMYVGLDELAIPVAAKEMGDSVSEGRDADFRTLAANCLKLWERTRDLRVATYYAIAACCTNGLEGFKQGLQLISYLIDNMWDDFYPKLDPEDDNDPTERVNILNMISPQSGNYNDPIQFLRRFREIKIVEELPYTLRQILIAQGMLESHEEPVDLVLFQAQLRTIPIDAFRQREALVDDLLTLANGIVSSMNERMGNAGFLSLDALIAEIRQLKRIMTSYSPSGATAGGAEQIQEDRSESATAEVVVSGEPAAPAKSVNVSGVVISTRAEALLLIARCAEYFKKHEPTSPIPYLLERASRFADMSFLDIMSEIDQNSLEKVREQLGIKPQE